MREERRKETGDEWSVSYEVHNGYNVPGTFHPSSPHFPSSCPPPSSPLAGVMWVHEVRDVVHFSEMFKFVQTRALNDLLAVPGMFATMTSNWRRDCFRSVDSGQAEVYKSVVTCVVPCWDQTIQVR